MSTQNPQGTIDFAEWLAAAPASGNQSIVDWAVATCELVEASDGRLYRKLEPRVRLAVPVSLMNSFSNQRLRFLLGSPKRDARGLPQSVRVTVSLDRFKADPAWEMNQAKVLASPELRDYAKFVSRRHLRATLEDDWVVVEDLGSTNGTWVAVSKLEVVTDEILRHTPQSLDP